MATWHHGLVARWWAEFNTGGPEIAYYRPVVEAGQPALDAGCGTGRLLLPWLRDGLDVDGCDVSPDMVALCREAAAREGLEPELYVRALHELELPRRYGAIVCCGTFGLGSTREQDAEGLRRLRDHLEPGGRLALDVEVFGETPEPSPRPLEPPGARRRGSDGAEYALRGHVVAYDSAARRVTRAIRAWQWRDGELAAEEEHVLTESLYEQGELVAMLEVAGFEELDVREGTSAWDDQMLVVVARRPLV